MWCYVSVSANTLETDLASKCGHSLFEINEKMLDSELKITSFGCVGDGQPW